MRDRLSRYRFYGLTLDRHAPHDNDQTSRKPDHPAQQIPARRLTVGKSHTALDIRPVNRQNPQIIISLSCRSIRGVRLWPTSLLPKNAPNRLRSVTATMPACVLWFAPISIT